MGTEGAGPTTAVLTELTERLGVTAIDPMLALRALTHRSWSAEHPGDAHNERLELLGDAVLELAVTAELHDRDPQASEGVLSRRRSQLVREATLADVARGLGLGAALRLGRGEAASGGADKDSLLSDALEALLGAAFLSVGYAATAAAVVRLLGARLAEVGMAGPDEGNGSGRTPAGPVDAKTALQERLAALRLPPPKYLTTAEGPAHAPTFRAEVIVDGALLGTGTGGTKKAASQAAAEQALRSEALG